MILHKTWEVSIWLSELSHWCQDFPDNVTSDVLFLLKSLVSPPQPQTQEPVMNLLSKGLKNYFQFFFPEYKNVLGVGNSQPWVLGGGPPCRGFHEFFLPGAGGWNSDDMPSYSRISVVPCSPWQWAHVLETPIIFFCHWEHLFYNTILLTWGLGDFTDK